MYQQFCMAASITNFSDKKLYLPSAALPFSCLTCGKIQSVSNCSFLTEFVQENTSIPFSEQKEDSILGWEMAREEIPQVEVRRDHSLGSRQSLLLPTLLLGWFVCPFVTPTYRKCILRRAFIPWAFLQSQYHNPGGLNYLINRKFEQVFPTPSSLSILLYPQKQALFWLILVQLNWNSCFTFYFFN